MKKNFITIFVDWYILNKENNGANYLANQFKGDRNRFIGELNEYTGEFVKSYKVNPFIVDMARTPQFKEELRKMIYSEDTSFHEYSASKNGHMPRAILGDKNYLEFLETLISGNEASQSLPQSPLPLPLKNSDIDNDGDGDSKKYDKKELKKIFYSRLKTQDRYYKFLLFPIRVLNKLFKHDEKDYFNCWLDTQLDQMIIHTENPDPILFKDLTSLEIKKNGKVLLNNKWTMLSLDKKREVRVKDLEEIEIDHIERFVDILEKLKDQLPALRDIHNRLFQANNEKAITTIEELYPAGNLVIDKIEHSGCANSILKDIKTDLDSILKYLRLQLIAKDDHRQK
jgi:hypothetical protein